MPASSDFIVPSIDPGQPRSPQGRRRRRWKPLKLLIGVLVTIGCLWWAVHVMAAGRPVSTFLREIRDAFARANYWTVPVIWVVLFVFYWIKSWRWRMLLTPLGDFPTHRLFPPVMIGFAFNNVLPAHLGDVVRVLVFSRRAGQPVTAVFTSVVLERVLDAIAILVLLGLGLVFMPGMDDPKVRASMLIFAAGICIALAGAGVYLIWTGPFVRGFEWTLGRLPLFPEGLKRKLATMLEQGAAGLASLKQGRLWVGLIATSFLQWSLNVLVIHLCLWSFGIRLSPLVSCIVMGVTAFGVTVPATPGYFGVIQLCFLGVLQFFTDDTVNVGAASIYYQIVQWVPVTAIGMFFFWSTGLDVAEVTEQAEGTA